MFVLLIVIALFKRSYDWKHILVRLQSKIKYTLIWRDGLSCRWKLNLKKESCLMLSIPGLMEGLESLLPAQTWQYSQTQKDFQTDFKK